MYCLQLYFLNELTLTITQSVYEATSTRVVSTSSISSDPTSECGVQVGVNGGTSAGVVWS